MFSDESHAGRNTFGPTLKRVIHLSQCFILRLSESFTSVNVSFYVCQSHSPQSMFHFTSVRAIHFSQCFILRLSEPFASVNVSTFSARSLCLLEPFTSVNDLSYVCSQQDDTRPRTVHKLCSNLCCNLLNPKLALIKIFSCTTYRLLSSCSNLVNRIAAPINRLSCTTYRVLSSSAKTHLGTD